MPTFTGSEFAVVGVAIAIAAVVCAYLSAMLFPLVSTSRAEILHTHGATDVFHLFELTWRGEVSGDVLLGDLCLLAVQVCLGSSVLFMVVAIVYLPTGMEAMVAVSLILGGTGGCCALELPTAYYSPSSRVTMDKFVFLTVYTCCWLVGAHLTFFNGWNQIFIYSQVCVGVICGSVWNFVPLRFAYINVVAFCVVETYVIYNAVQQEVGRIFPSAVALASLSVCLGFLVSGGMVHRTNPFTAVVCLVFGELVWFGLSQAIYFEADALVLRAPLFKVGILCVEICHSCVVMYCMCGFLRERDYSNAELFPFVVAVVAFNFLFIY